MNIVKSAYRFVQRGINKQKLKRQYDCLFDFGVYLDLETNVLGYVDIQRNTKILKCELNTGTNIGRDNLFVKCKIGKYCLFGDFNRNIFGRHPTTQYVAMHSFFYYPQKHSYAKEILFDDLYKYADKENKFHNIIGNDVYITNNVLILEGVKIADGAIVTPGSVVTKNVPPYAIVRGNPAKVVAYRFKKNEIKFLQKLQWWNKDDKWLSTHVDDFKNIKILMKRVIEEEKWNEEEFI